MKICLLTRSHFPGDSRIHSKIASSLVAAGNQVHVICRSRDLSKENQFISDSIHYHTVPLSRIRGLDFKGAYQIPKIAFSLEVDLLITFEPRTLILGWVHKAIKGTGLIYDCHEFWPEKFSELLPSGLSQILKKIVGFIERWFAQRANNIWVVNEKIANRFKDHHNPVVLLPNYPLPGHFQENPELPLALLEDYQNKYVLIYVGGITESRGISNCLKVLAELTDIIANVQMIFLGPFGHGYEVKMEDEIRELGLEENVSILGVIEHEQVPNYLSLADLGLFLLQPDKERYSWSEPIKFFEYMAAGLPVVMSDLPAIRRLVDTIGNGILVNPLNHNQVAKRISALLHNPDLCEKMRIKGFQAFQETYNWQVIVPRMLAAIEEVHSEMV